MGKSKLKRKVARLKRAKEDEQVDKGIPIPNLPRDFLWMHVKSGTKIRNVLRYALEKFADHKCIVWSGAGHGIGKTISCAELFKRKQEGLYQITKLRYVESKKSKEEVGDLTKKPRRVPEIHILLSKDIITEPGYQAPDDEGEFPIHEELNPRNRQEDDRNLSHTDTKEFAEVGSSTAQKRQKKEKVALSKKSKKMQQSAEIH